MSRIVRVIWPREDVTTVYGIVEGVKTQGPDFIEEQRKSYLERFAEFSGASLKLMELIAAENCAWTSDMMDPSATPANDDPESLRSAWEKWEQKEKSHPSHALVADMRKTIRGLLSADALSHSAIVENFADDDYVGSDIRHAVSVRGTVQEDVRDRMLFTALHFIKVVSPNLDKVFREMNSELLFVVKTCSSSTSTPYALQQKSSFMHQLIECNRLEVLLLGMGRFFKANGQENIGLIAESLGEYMHPLANDITRRASVEYKALGWKPRPSPWKTARDAFVFKL